MLKTIAMPSIISLGFPYQGEEHYVLVSEKSLDQKKFYRITIMNGDLEKLLSDANIIFEENNRLLLDDCHGNKQRLELKKEIVKALADHLKKEIIHLYQQDNW